MKNLLGIVLIMSSIKTGIKDFDPTKFLSHIQEIMEKIKTDFQFLKEVSNPNSPYMNKLLEVMIFIDSNITAKDLYSRLKQEEESVNMENNLIKWKHLSDKKMFEELKKKNKENEYNQLKSEEEKDSFLKEINILEDNEKKTLETFDFYDLEKLFTRLLSKAVIISDYFKVHFKNILSMSKKDAKEYLSDYFLYYQYFKCGLRRKVYPNKDIYETQCHFAIPGFREKGNFLFDGILGLWFKPKENHLILFVITRYPSSLNNISFYMNEIIVNHVQFTAPVINLKQIDKIEAIVISEERTLPLIDFVEKAYEKRQMDKNLKEKLELEDSHNGGNLNVKTSNELNYKHEKYQGTADISINETKVDNISNKGDTYIINKGNDKEINSNLSVKENTSYNMDFDGKNELNQIGNISIDTNKDITKEDLSFNDSDIQFVSEVENKNYLYKINKNILFRKSESAIAKNLQRLSEEYGIEYDDFYLFNDYHRQGLSFCMYIENKKRLNLLI